jgi:hypothetical protein
MSDRTLVDPDVMRKVRWHPLHTSRRAYEQGLAHGCELCSFVSSILPLDSRDLRTSFSFQSRDRLWIIESSISRQMIEYSVSRRTPLPIMGKSIRFNINRVDGPTRSTTEIHNPAVAACRSSHTCSSEALHLASLWLKECTSRHRRCARLSKPTWYPTRAARGHVLDCPSD